MVSFLKSLYGDDYINIILKIVFEYLFYFLASLFGAMIRELTIEKNRKLSRALGSALITSVILTTFGNIIRSRVSDSRLIFGLSVLIGMNAPNFTNSLKNGKFFKAIVGLFSVKIRKFLDECEDIKKTKK